MVRVAFIIEEVLDTQSSPGVDTPCHKKIPLFQPKKKYLGIKNMYCQKVNYIYIYKTTKVNANKKYV